MRDKWLLEEVERLIEMYPTYKKETILNEFAGRSWRKIQIKAARIGVKRGTYASTRDYLMKSIEKYEITF